MVGGLRLIFLFFSLLKIVAPLGDTTLVALGLAGKAGVASVQDKPMVRLW